MAKITIEEITISDRELVALLWASAKKIVIFTDNQDEEIDPTPPSPSKKVYKKQKPVAVVEKVVASKGEILSDDDKKARKREYMRDWYRKNHPKKESVKKDDGLIHPPGGGTPYKKDKEIEYGYCANPDCQLGAPGKFVKGTGIVMGKYIFHNQSCAEDFGRKRAY